MISSIDWLKSSSRSHQDDPDWRVKKLQMESSPLAPPPPTPPRPPDSTFLYISQNLTLLNLGNSNELGDNKLPILQLVSQPDTTKGSLEERVKRWNFTQVLPTWPSRSSVPYLAA